MKNKNGNWWRGTTLVLLMFSGTLSVVVAEPKSPKSDSTLLTLMKENFALKKELAALKAEMAAKEKELKESQQQKAAQERKFERKEKIFTSENELLKDKIKVANMILASEDTSVDDLYNAYTGANDSPEEKGLTR